jgi:hypothetical protein
MALHHLSEREFVIAARDSNAHSQPGRRKPPVFLRFRTVHPRSPKYEATNRNCNSMRHPAALTMQIPKPLNFSQTSEAEMPVLNGLQRRCAQELTRDRSTCCRRTCLRSAIQLSRSYCSRMNSCLRLTHGFRTKLASEILVTVLSHSMTTKARLVSTNCSR